MGSLNLVLSDEITKYIEQQVTTGQYANSNEFVSHMVEEYQRLKAWEQLDSQIEVGLNSGPGRELTDEVWNELWEKAEQQAAAMKGTKNEGDRTQTAG